jgi:outer membrane immunogenic protein
MKRLILTAVFAFAASGLALTGFARAEEPEVISADMAAPEQPAMPVAERWGGIYAGVSVGYGFLKDTIPAQGKDWIYGGFVGYNHQWGNFVAGVEGGIDRADILFDDGSGIASEYIYTGRVRAGWGNDKVFIYGSLGAEHGTTINLPPANSKDTALQLGGGFEYAVTDKVAVGTDYTYTKYKEFGDLPLDVTTQRLQARLIYTFN